MLALVLALFAAACGEDKDDEPAAAAAARTPAPKDCGKVVLNEQAWAGSTANTYIAKAVLEDELGCEVEITKIAEIPVFQAMADGKVDAVLEDWQHVDEYEQYIDKAGTVVQGGPLGVEGHIGWFIPKYLDGREPRVRDLGGPEGQGGPVQDRRVGRPGHVPRRRPELRPEGQGADRGARPQLQARDRRRRAGAGRALEQLYKQKKPVIFYWYTPQYLNQEYDLAEVKLPPRTDANKDCKDDAKAGGDPEQYKCEYDVTIINKLFSKKFADSGSPAYDVLKKMKLTNEDQEAVAKAIAGDKVDPEKAGQDWVDGERRTRSTPGWSKPPMKLGVPAVAAFAGPSVAGLALLDPRARRARRCQAATGRARGCTRARMAGAGGAGSCRARSTRPARAAGGSASTSAGCRRAARGSRHPALVAVEGGPGYPSTGSRVEYTGIYGPLLRERGLLLVDNRGTGGSALIRLPAPAALSPASAPARRFPRVVADCAREIERRHGSADLFATAYAARDMAAVIRALRLGRVDLSATPTGPSSCSRSSRATRACCTRCCSTPRIRCVVSTRGTSPRGPWRARAMDAVCARDPGCSAAAPGSATARLGSCSARLRRSRAHARLRRQPRRVRFGVRALVDLVQDAASEPLIYRELDPAVRAALAGDETPLLRLVAEIARLLHGAGGDRRLLLERPLLGRRLHGLPAAVLDGRAVRRGGATSSRRPCWPRRRAPSTRSGRASG